MSDLKQRIATWMAVIGCIATIAGCVVLPTHANATEPTSDPDAASATLPLGEILKLYRQRDEAERTRDVAPPVAATLQKLELEGRLLEDGIDFSIHFEVVVLGDENWVSVPLLAYDTASHVSKLPNVSGGSFAVSDGHLVFLTKKSGRYNFDLSLYRAAEKDDRMRRVELLHGGAALATCRLEIDGGLFELQTEQAIEARDGVLVFPKGDAFEIAWRVHADAEPESTERRLPPAIESVVSQAHVSTVSTLEGRRITRVLYELRFAGRKPFSIDLPEGQTLQRAFLNGVATPVKSQDGRLELELAPARAGEEGGTLELVLSHPGAAFHLAGSLHFDLPAVAWPTHEMDVTLHLPRVFDYHWAGGSLAPRTKATQANYSYELPMPGKGLSFHQVLIGESPPDLDLRYEVSLEGHYFQDRPPHSRAEHARQQASPAAVDASTCSVSSQHGGC